MLRVGALLVAAALCHCAMGLNLTNGTDLVVLPRPQLSSRGGNVVVATYDAFTVEYTGDDEVIELRKLRDSLNRQIAVVSGRLTATGKDLDALRTYVDNDVVETINSVVINSINPLDADMHTNKVAIKQLNEDVGDLRKDVGGIETNVGDLRKDVGGIETNVGGLRNDLGGLKTNVDSLNSAVDTLKKQMIIESGRITALNTELNSVKNNFPTITGISDKVNRIIDCQKNGLEFTGTKCESSAQHVSTCNSASQGAIKYDPTKEGLVYCQSGSWVILLTLADGTKQSTGNTQSCHALYKRLGTLSEGKYWFYSISGTHFQAFCKKFHNDWYTKVLFLKSNEFCYGSGNWHRKSPLRESYLHTSSGGYSYDALGTGFFGSNVDALVFQTNRGDIKIEFEKQDTPQKLMGSNSIRFKHYPEYIQWRNVFGQDRDDTPIFMRGGSISNYDSSVAPGGIKSPCRRHNQHLVGCGKPCHFCFQASDSSGCRQTWQQTGGYDCCDRHASVNDVSSGLGLNSYYCGGGRSDICSQSGIWSTRSSWTIVWAR